MDNTWKNNNLLRMVEGMTADLFSDGLYEGDLAFDTEKQIELSNQGYKYAVIYDWEMGDTDRWSGMPTTKKEVWKLFDNEEEAYEFAKEAKHPYGGTDVTGTGWIRKLTTQEEKDADDAYWAEIHAKKDATNAKRKATITQKMVDLGFDPEDKEGYKAYNRLVRKKKEAEEWINNYPELLKSLEAQLEDKKAQVEKLNSDIDSMLKH